MHFLGEYAHTTRAELLSYLPVICHPLGTVVVSMFSVVACLKCMKLLVFQCYPFLATCSRLCMNDTAVHWWYGLLPYWLPGAVNVAVVDRAGQCRPTGEILFAWERQLPVLTASRFKISDFQQHLFWTNCRDMSIAGQNIVSMKTDFVPSQLKDVTTTLSSV